MPSIQVFEHERLTIHEDQFKRSITPNQLEKLCQFNDNNKNKYFTVIRNGVKFANYVGVIQIGSLVIEILPKADKVTLTNTNKEAAFKKWRGVLLRMLAISGDLKVETVSDTMLKRRYNSLLELYFDLYLKEVSQLLRKGLIKKYRKESSNVLALKGRIQFSKNIQQNLIHQERFYTIHQTYDYEHLINQVLLKGLCVLKTLSINESTISKADKLQFLFPDIKEINIDQASFDKININRKTESYTQALNIAKMLILNYSPDISKGQDNMIALLFDMNKLWEKYIYKRLKQGEDGSYSVGFQNQQKFWENRVIKPDLVIEKGTGDSKETVIIDTKWRLVEDNKPSDDELKQMFAYNSYWESTKSILLFPKFESSKDGKFGTFHKGIKGEHLCKVAYVDVLDNDNTLSLNISKEILEKIESA